MKSTENISQTIKHYFSRLKDNLVKYLTIFATLLYQNQ